MNKQNYKNYIDKMISLKEREIDGKYQKHHIIPKCLGGTDDEANIVKLTIEEHIEAHKELANCFDNGTYERNSNLSAANVLYVWLNRKSDIDLSGENNPMWGKSHSEETKVKISIKSKQKIYSDEYRNKLRQVFMGNKNHRWGVKLSDETKKKISEAQTGEKHHWWGTNRSDETKKKISEGQPNRVKVSKYNIELVKLETYDSIAEAAKSNGISTGNLSGYLSKPELTKYGSRRMLGGFIWKVA